MKWGVIVVAVIVAGCASTSSQDMGIKPVVFQGNKEVTFARAIEAVSELGWSVKFADKDAGVVTASTPVNAWTFGDDVTLTLIPNTSETTRIECNSRTPGQVIGWGKNRRNIERILNQIQNGQQ